MIFKRLMTGMFSSNCYIIGENGKGAIIDPGVTSDELLEVVKSLGLTISYIILTHSHIDHIVSVDEVREATGAKVMVHEADSAALSSEWYNGSAMFGINKTFKQADVLLKDGDIVELDELKLEIIHTPGHTPGGICIKVKDDLFTGDTLFRRSIGRTDLGNGDKAELDKSLKRLMKLDYETVVHPGHGSTSTIGYEKNNNPYIDY